MNNLKELLEKEKKCFGKISSVYKSPINEQSKRAIGKRKKMLWKTILKFQQ